MTKIYVKELTAKLNLINIEQYLIKIMDEYYMYSDDNIYRILSNRIVKLNQHDFPCTINRLDDFTLLMDKSKYSTDKSYITHIPFDHEIIKIIRREYKLNPLAEIKFVTETRYSNNSKFLSDFYFILNEGINDLDYFIKENIHTFLSLLRNV